MVGIRVSVVKLDSKAKKKKLGSPVFALRVANFPPSLYNLRRNPDLGKTLSVEFKRNMEN